MLKIKDNVDLEELEKFMFIRTYVIDFKFTKCEEDYYYWKHLKVDLKTRTISLIEREKNDVEYEYSLVKLFELIQAGLVEKVGDE